MNQISRIGMDTSKHFFQLHGVDAQERVVLRRKLDRRQVLDCRVAALLAMTSQITFAPLRLFGSIY